MIEGLINLDKELLLFFNHLNNSFLDFLFFWISDKWIWIPFYAFLAWYVYQSEKKLFLIVLVFIAVAITLSDQIASSLIKEHVMRLRPCHDPSISFSVHLVNNYCGGMYGFVSSHAANVFALATFLAGLFKRRYLFLQRTLWIWAVVVSFSRIYLGAHYPGDILGGAIVGIFSGYVSERSYLAFITYIAKRKNNSDQFIKSR